MNETVLILQLLLTGASSIAVFFMGLHLKNLSDTIRGNETKIDAVRKDLFDHVSNHEIHSAR